MSSSSFSISSPVLRWISLSTLAVAMGFFLTERAHASCDGEVSASGRAANPMSYNPPQHYDMEAKARAAAVSAWSAVVRSGCAGSRDVWQKAKSRSISCEGYAGGLSCEARGVPAKL